jgi:hypothetical protein
MALHGVIEARLQHLNIASEASRAALEEMLAGVYACRPEDETVYELVGPHHNLFLFLTLPLAKGGHATSEELWISILNRVCQYYICDMPLEMTFLTNHQQHIDIVDNVLVSSLVVQEPLNSENFQVGYLTRKVKYIHTISGGVDDRSFGWYALETPTPKWWGLLASARSPDQF